MFPGFPKLDEGYKVKLSKVGDSFLEVATFGDGTTFTTPWKYDEEAPFLGISYLIPKNISGKHYNITCQYFTFFLNCIHFFAKDCIFLMTKIPGGNKVICRKPTGQIQEYTTKFTEAGMFQV